MDGEDCAALLMVLRVVLLLDAFASGVTSLSKASLEATKNFTDSQEWKNAGEGMRKQEKAGGIAGERHRRCQMRGHEMLLLARILDIREGVTSY